MEAQHSPRRGWELAKLVFQATLAVAPPQRRAFILRICGHDPRLQAEVERLLAAHEGAARTPPVPSNLPATTSRFFPNQSFPNRRLGPYRIIRLLGHSKRGEVWQAEDTRRGSLIALKLLPAGFFGQAERRQQFTREARTLAHLNHPNLPSILEIGQVHGLSCLAAELVYGHSLRQRMNQAQPTVSEALDVMIQVADALAAAHAAGLVHRNLKLENVMMRRDGLVRLLDFGLPRLTAETSTAAPLGTGVGVAWATAPPPERPEAADARADIFDLGVMLYELLSGRAPFVHRPPTAGAARPADPLAAPTIPPVLRQILRKALSQERKHSYQTARGLQADLQRVRQELEGGARLHDPPTPDFGRVFALPHEPHRTNVQTLRTNLKRLTRNGAPWLTLLLILVFAMSLYQWLR
jgi:serine/threonine-protein kinase